MARPLRISCLSTRPYRAQSPKHRAVDGKYGTGATTTLSTSPLATKWRNLFSTNAPWFGCSEFGNSVVKVSSLSGRRLADTEYIGKQTILRDTTVCRPKHRFHRTDLNLGDVDIASTTNLLAYLVYGSEFLPAMMARLRKLSMTTSYIHRPALP
jgi:hypothetical protein